MSNYNRTLSQVRQQNKAIGGYWFEPATIRFFRSIIHSRALIADRYFITSEELTTRTYSIREADLEGNISTVETGFKTLEDVKNRVLELVK